MSSRVRERGFSLIELMVVLGLAGTILAFSMPTINRYLHRARLRDSVNRVMGEMRLARQKAVTNNSVVWFWMADNTNYYWIGEQRWTGGTNYTPTLWKGPYYLPSTVVIRSPNFSAYNYFYYKPDGRSWTGAVPPNGIAAAGTMRMIGTAGVRDTITVNLDLAGAVWK